MRIAELAKLLDATVIEFAEGNEEITHASAIEDGDAGAISFIGNPHYEHFLGSTQASAVIVGEQLTTPNFGDRKPPVLVRVKRPYEAFARALEIFKPAKTLIAKGIHPSAVVAESAQLDPTVNVGVNAYISDRVRIGANSNVLPGAQIGADTIIGKNCVIHANAVIYDHVEIGDCVVIGPGSVIGYDGFGYVPIGDGRYRKIPQVGNVIIEDDVEIGANTTIDRATIAETRIKKGSKLDNLIQIGHNVEIGENTVIAAQTGISGSTKIGRQNVIAGQVGFTGHITTTDNVIVGAQSGVSKSVTKAGTYFGYPAKNHREALKLEGALRSLPELIERVRQLEEKLKEQA
jgi:UDP-3-O-[3-hydroxymyristoyl] glucosamine N-acyltransferase